VRLEHERAARQQVLARAAQRAHENGAREHVVHHVAARRRDRARLAHAEREQVRAPEAHALRDAAAAPPCDREHLARAVDADHGDPRTREPLGDESRAAAEVEHPGSRGRARAIGSSAAVKPAAMSTWSGVS
jgi:hypothetical protein